MRSVEVRLRSSLRCPSNISRWRFLPLEFLVRKGHLPDSAELTPNAIEDCRHPLHSRLCGSLLRHGSNRPQLNCLALGRPQIPAQLSAPVRPGGSLTEAKCWAVRFPCGGGAVQHLSRQIRPTESFARLRSLPVQQLETCCIRKRRSNNTYSSEAVDISVFRRLDSSSDVLSPPPP